MARAMTEARAGKEMQKAVREGFLKVSAPQSAGRKDREALPGSKGGLRQYFPVE